MAIHSLKHRAFKIWAAVAVSGPLTLWLLSLMKDADGLAIPLAVLGVLFALAYALSGWLASRLALGLMPSLLQEAGIWERNGDIERAEIAYQKAMALYDSFLTAPAVRRRGIPPLVSRMARMYAAQTDRHSDADRFMERYLSTYPTDREIAETWLQTRTYQGGLTPGQQELATRIGDAHAGNAAIQMTLARLYLLTRRTDFPALQTYRRAMAAPPAKVSTLPLELAPIFIQEGRCDEWALPVYLVAARREPPEEDLRCALAACLRWIPLSDRNADWLTQARRILGAPDDDTLVRMSSGFVPPSGGYPAKGNPPRRDVDTGNALHDGPFKRLRDTAARLDRSRRHLRTSVVEALRRSPRLRHGFTWGLMAVLGVVAIVFLINTVGYLTISPTPDPPPAAPEPVAAPAPPMPYTLQVAAYLAPEHAERYLTVLKKQAIDAYVIKAHGNDKTWYQVRIAHFPDKATALAHGSDLKARGIIDDFYVAMDQRP